MGYAVQDLRNLLVLARILRRCAQDPAYDADCGLFLETAAALESRAFSIAISGELSGGHSSAQADKALHAPVDLKI
jgi:hypothetical protein